MAVVALFVLLAALGYFGLPSDPSSEPRAPIAAARDTYSHAPSMPVATPASMPATTLTPPLPRPPPSAANRPEDPSPPAPKAMPYRFIGKSPAGSETSIVLFGRGRIVSLREPGPLDDEYVVEAVYDDYLLIRHAPTGVGTFLEFTRRQPALASARDPEDSPRD